MRRNLTALAAGAVAGGALALTVACSADGGSDGERAEAPATLRGEALYDYPFDTLEDWVSYGDAVVVATVTGEERIEPGPDDAEGIERGEGVLIGRDLTVEVDEVLWQHPSLTDIPDTLAFQATGWVLAGGEEKPFAYEDDVRPEVGEQYVMALRVDGEDGELGPVSRGVLPTASNGRIEADVDAAVVEGERPPAGSELAGLSADEVAAEITATPPNVVAEANRDLDVAERYQAVVAAQEAVAGG